MPQIFDEITRENLKIQMLNNGFNLIKKYGYKKTSIEDITKMTGIAKGTFYNFFPNKEEFIYQIILMKRNILKDKFNTLISTSPLLTRNQLQEYLELLVFGDNNLFIYFTEQDIGILKLKWPKEYLLNTENDEKMCNLILSHIKDKQPNCDWKVFANYIKTISIIQNNKEILHQDVFRTTLNCFIQDVLDYIYKN